MIDRDADRALYKQLADRLREEIMSGERPPGSPLPSEIYLEQTTGLSRTAVRKAIDLILNEGLVSKGQGQPTVVRERPERRVVTLASGVDIDTRMPTDAERKQLGIPVGEPVFEVRHKGGDVELLPGASVTLRSP